jgi:hypothetical protein
MVVVAVVIQSFNWISDELDYFQFVPTYYSSPLFYCFAHAPGNVLSSIASDLHEVS